VAELRRLQDEAPPVPYEQVRGRIESELGRPLERIFARFDATPLSAASLGQVHAAALADGREVTVKVLRPDARRVVEADLQILGESARLLHRQVPALHVYDLPRLVRQFSDQIHDELVYTLEGHSADRLRETLRDAGIKVQIPEVIWELTTREVLTTERVRGQRVDRLTGVSFDRTAAARALGHSLLHQIFVDGFFHGDPHQGNVLFGDEGEIIMLDFGLMGYLDPRSRALLGEIVGEVYGQDVDGVIAAMCELGTVGPGTDLASLRGDLAGMISRFVALPRREFPLGEMLTRMLRALWLNQMRAPAELALAAKAVLMTESICSELDPTFDFRELAQPVIAEAKARLLSGEAILDRTLRAGRATARHLGRLPERVDRLLGLAGQGNLRLRVEDPSAEGRWAGLGRAVNRLSLSILSGSLLLCGAIYLGAAKNAAHVGLGAAAAVSGAVLGLVVALSLLRPGRV